MKYSLTELVRITNGEIKGNTHITTPIHELAFDSRKITDAAHTAFIAIIARRDGHDFISAAYNKGCRQFIISQAIPYARFPEATFLLVSDTLVAIQNLAIHHRQQNELQVLAITGSNGKTIVKEWLHLLLETYKEVVYSPKGWNSLLGVPLSILEIESQHKIAIIETGISQQDEMRIMRDIVLPTQGIITNIGDAHESGFESMDQKLNEKLSLFTQCNTLYFCKDQAEITAKIETQYSDKTLISWSIDSHRNASYTYSISQQSSRTEIVVSAPTGEAPWIIQTQIKGKMYLENLLHCVTIAHHMGVPQDMIKMRLPLLRPIPYRSKILAGKNDCVIIDDSYSFDKKSMASAAALLDDNALGRSKVVILSDDSSHKHKARFYKDISEVLERSQIDQILHVGADGDIAKEAFSTFSFSSYDTALDLQAEIIKRDYADTAFLIKGARHFELEKISSLLAARSHTSVLEINLESISHNIGVYARHLNPDTGIVAIIKAGAYGSGSTELARHLEKQGIQMLAVATIDEGVALRKAGIVLPILILNPVPDGFHLLSQYDLEPEIYSLSILEQLIPYTIGTQKVKIHIKIDTGMNRFGFELSAFRPLVSLLSKGNIEVSTVFSHLSASGDTTKRKFTLKQLATFQLWSDLLISLLPNTPKRHILNTNGILHYPEFQYDMVRMGLGMYGVSMNPKVKNQLKKAHRLTSIIAHIKNVQRGETVGYGAEYFVDKDRVIAHIPIGYADGIMRSMSHGQVSFYINGHLCPTIGYVCMDMLMLDITGHKDIEIGDQVEIFGDNVDLYDLAIRCQTIPYEILTKISQRVKRVYIQD